MEKASPKDNCERVIMYKEQGTLEDLKTLENDLFNKFLLELREGIEKEMTLCLLTSNFTPYKKIRLIFL